MTLLTAVTAVLRTKYFPAFLSQSFFAAVSGNFFSRFVERRYIALFVDSEGAFKPAVENRIELVALAYQLAGLLF